MGKGFAWVVRLLVCVATTARAETLADVLRASGAAPPASLADLDRQLNTHIVSREGGETLIVYDTGDPRGPASLIALRLEPATLRQLFGPPSAD